MRHPAKGGALPFGGYSVVLIAAFAGVPIKTARKALSPLPGVHVGWPQFFDDQKQSPLCKVCPHADYLDYPQ